MAVPAVAWLGTRHKAYSYIMFPSIGFFTVMLMLTLSRGNILFGLPIICVSFVYGFIKTRVKGARIIAVAILAACVVLFFALPICDKIIYKLFDGYKQGFFDPHGRIEIYKRAWKNFRESPIFGVGYIKPKDVVFTVDGPSLSFLWKTHNTFLQILSCSGVVGLWGMLPFFVQRYFTLIKNFDGFKFMALLCVLGYALEGMVDVTFLSVHQVFFVFGLLAAAGYEYYDAPSENKKTPKRLLRKKLIFSFRDRGVR